MEFISFQSIATSPLAGKSFNLFGSQMDALCEIRITPNLPVGRHLKYVLS